MLELDRGRSAALRAKLLLGVAGATAAATSAAYADPAATTPPTDTDKWAPYVDIGGSVGSGMTAGRGDAFVPIWQNLDSLVFANLAIGTETKTNQFENFNGGFRTKINPDWIVGGYVGFDSTQLQDTNTFNQTSIGAEAMSADWDARLNAYIAGNQIKAAGPDSGHELYINGTTIAVLDSAEAAYTGFDGEVGYRVFSTDDTDVRVFIGGFHFSHVNSNSASLGQTFDFGYRPISGPKARAEATVYDLDLLGNQSRFTLDGEIAHDDVRGTTGYVGATLRIAIGDFGSGAQALDELDRRMVDPERRNDTVLTRGQFDKPEPVIIYGAHVTSQPTNTLIYVAGGTTGGAGTYANPTTLADATSRHTTNAFIVLDSKGGPITGGATLQPGQTVVPGGNTFTVEGTLSHAKFTHLFDPSSSVTVVPATAGGTVFTLASNTSLYDLNIKGDFGTAIYGKNVDNVNISGVTIDGTGGGHTGIDIVHTKSGEENVTIQNVTISNLTEDGIDLTSNIADGGSSTESFKLSNITVSNVGGYGIDISDYASQGSKITSNISLSNITVTGAQFGDIGVYANAYGNGSSVSQTVAISNASVTSTSGYGGIAVSAYASNGASVTQNATLSNVAITGGSIFVGANAYGAGSSVAQSFVLSNATITSPVYAGISFEAFATNGGTITATDTLAQLTLSGGYEEAIGARSIAFGAGSAINQTLSVTNATISDFDYGGFDIEAEAIHGAAVDQSVSIAHTTISDVGANTIFAYGVRDFAEAEGAGSVVNQTVDISNTYISEVGNTLVAGTGMTFEAYARYGAATAQYLTLTNVGVTNAASDGIDLYVNARDNGTGVTTVYQKATITGATITDNAGVGIFADAYAASASAGYKSQAAAAQNVSITNATLSGNRYGMQIFATAIDGASVTQSVYAYNIAIERSSRIGVHIVADAESVGSVTQSVTFTNAAGSYNEISYNGTYGVDVVTAAKTGGQVNQHLYIYATNIDQNALDGVHIENTSQSYYYAHNGKGLIHYSHIQQNLIMEYGSVSHNGGNGIYMSNTVTYGAAEDQFLYLFGVKLDHNTGGSGFYDKSVVRTYGSSYLLPTDLHAKIYIVNSDLSYNSGTGATILSQLYGPMSYLPGATVKFPHSATTPATDSYSELQQYITIEGSTFTHNAGSGLQIIAEDYGLRTVDEQIISISGSEFASNGGDGADIIARQTYGTGPYGDAIQSIKIANSDFSHNNYGNGLYALAGAYGEQGRAEQYFTVTNSTFNYNGQNGIYLNRVAQNGVSIPGFSCYTVQNPSGGCAFVRQTFEMIGGSASYNGANGLYIRTNAYSFGAVYATAEQRLITEYYQAKGHAPVGYALVPTVVLVDAQFNGNGNNGFYASTYAGKHSYVYSYVVAVDSTFNNNGRNGIARYGSGFASSTFTDNSSYVIEHRLLYSYATGTQANNNLGAGVMITDFGEIFSRNSTSGLYGTSGITANRNGYDGVDIFALGALQYNTITGNTLSYNQLSGIRLEAAFAYQGTTFVGNTITSNMEYGVYANASTGSLQRIHITTGGNTVTGNGTSSADNYHFVVSGGTQDVY